MIENLWVNRPSIMIFLNIVTHILTLLMLRNLFHVTVLFSGASRVIASGGRVKNRRDMTETGAHGQSLDRVPGHVEVVFALAADSATTPRES